MPIPLLVRASDFDNQVYRPFVSKLRSLGASGDTVDIVSSDRLSLILTSGASTRAEDGMDKQIALLADRFPDDPDIQLYSELPADIFRYVGSDPERLERDLSALGHSGCWLTYNDLYPEQRGTAFAAMVLINRQLFLRINASAADRQITMVDGSVHNAIGLLQASVVRALGTRKTLRVSEDPMRFSRDSLAAERALDACIGAQWRIAFGTMTFAPNEGAVTLMTLRSLAQIGQVENELRARKRASHTLSRYKDGLTYLPEKQMPAGFRHARDIDGKRVRSLDAYVPEFEPRMAGVIEEAVELHADGTSYLDLGRLLAQHDVPLRGMTSNAAYNSSGDLLTDGTLTEAARNSRLRSLGTNFFRIATLVDLPWRHPDDPLATEVDQQFAEAYTGKLTLWATGRYTSMRELGVLRGIKAINDVEVVYLANSDIGHLPMDCRWALDAHGASTLPINLSQDAVARSRKRLLDERSSRAPQGGTAHHRRRVAWLPQLPTWLDGEYDYTDPPCDRRGRLLETTVRTYRMRNSEASDNSVTHHCRSRPAHQSLQRTDVGWRERAGFEAHEGDILFSVSASELAASVASEAKSLIGDQLDGVTAAVVLDRPRRLPPSTAVVDRRRPVALEQLERREDQQAGARVSRDEQRGRLSRAESSGEPTESIARELEACEKRLADAGEAVDLARAELAALDGELAAGARQVSSPVMPATAPLAVVAYLIAALERTSASDGRVSPEVAALIAEHMTEWEFSKQTEGVVTWSCTLAWDADEHEASVRLTGIVDNMNRRKGRASGELAQIQVLHRGVAIDDFLATERVRRQRTGVVAGLDLHLYGLLPRDTLCPLLDHPLPHGRSYIYRRGVLHQPALAPVGWSEEFAAHMLWVYTDPSVNVRPGAAVPQRIDLWHALQVGLLHVGGTAPIDAVAREWGIPLVTMRNHLRAGGGIGMARLNPFRTTVREVSLEPCIFEDCSNAYASHACALPEILATGHSAICPSCRRVPDTTWSHLVVPPEYVTHRWTRRLAAGVRGGSPFGPPNPMSKEPPHRNPMTLLCQAQTVEWAGQGLILPAPVSHA